MSPKKIHRILNDDKKTVNSFSKIVVKKSIIIFLSRLFILHFIHFVFLITLYIVFVLVPGTSMGGILSLFGIIVTSTIVVVVLSFYIYYRWKGHYYTVLPNGVVENKGVFRKFEKSYACSRIESVLLRQSLIGRILNFGTVSIYDPFLEKSIYLTNIDNPIKMGEVLKRIYVTEKEMPEEVALTSSDDKIIADRVDEPPHSNSS